MSEQAREPTPDELDILRQLAGATNAVVQSFTRWYDDGQLPDMPDERFLKMSAWGERRHGQLRWKATFWATKAGRALMAATQAASDGE